MCFFRNETGIITILEAVSSDIIRTPDGRMIAVPPDRLGKRKAFFLSARRQGGKSGLQEKMAPDNVRRG